MAPLESDQTTMKNKVAIIASVGVILVLLAVGSGIAGVRSGSFHVSLPGPLSKINITGPSTGPVAGGNIRVVSEESVTIDVVKKVTPAVVTVGITTMQPTFNAPDFGFGPFGFFQAPSQQQGTQQIKQDIGSGFIIRSDGLVVTNKHVVSDTTAKYRIITADNKTYDVQKIYRDPNNDIAILQISASGLPTVELGDSDHLQVGQFALAIGTALGEFRSTVTTGVISGIGRSITAGTSFTGSEQLSNIIQTSAPINPGNSGGPLLNSSGQVVGVNVAVAQDAQNIGFALPINLVKQEISAFEANGGQFAARAYLGVEYQMVSRDLSVLDQIPEGAYVQSVVSGGPADTAGVQQGDIITKIDGRQLTDTNGGLAAVIKTKKPGDSVALTIYHSDNSTSTVQVKLGEAPQ